MNKVLKYLTMYDIFVLGGFGLITPIFSIYINDEIIGGSIFTAGVATTIYTLTKALVQIPTSRYTDREDGNKREFNVLLIGSFLVAIVPVLYIITDDILEIYFIQLLLGLGGGLSYPGWMTIFSRFIEKGKEGYCWSLYDTIATFSVAFTAMVGAYIAQEFGFKIVFYLLSVLVLFSVVLVLMMHKHISTKE